MVLLLKLWATWLLAWDLLCVGQLVYKSVVVLARGESFLVLHIWRGLNQKMVGFLVCIKRPNPGLVIKKRWCYPDQSLISLDDVPEACMSRTF